MILEKKVALVTEISQGNGRAVAQLLREKGFRVFGPIDDDCSVEQRAIGETSSKGMDFGTEHSVTTALHKFKSMHAQLDLLVTVPRNANTAELQPSVTVENLRATLEVEVVRIAAIIEAFLPLLIESKQGRIVNVSTATASMQTGSSSSRGRGAASCIAMTALNALTLYYARELAPYRIKVNAVAPDGGIMGIPLAGSEGALEDSAQLIVQLGTSGDDGPTGGFFSPCGPIPW
jgi:NAD(P)-dependent dehydrogenase (short-subunit alcohol dehydrogenase family)